MKRSAPLNPGTLRPFRHPAFEFASLPLHAPQSRQGDPGVPLGPTGRGFAPRTLGSPGDQHERDADRVADELVRGPLPSIAAAAELSSGSAGNALTAPAREFFEPRLRHDLGAVRVHADASAARSASALRARAYTAGNEIVFGRDQYQPSTLTGRRLLAHELAHVVQQRERPALRETIQRAPMHGTVLDGAAAAPTTGQAAREPTDPPVDEPTELKDEKKLDKGHMSWRLRVDFHGNAVLSIDFKPDDSRVQARNISFGQAVIGLAGTQRSYPEGTEWIPSVKAKYEPFEDPKSNRWMDHVHDAENDPFYGAQWDQATKMWTEEPGDIAVGSSTTSASPAGASFEVAKMYDRTTAPEARRGLGKVDVQFETVAMVLETREPLGALRWGYRIEDAKDARIELTGATQADCVNTPSDSWCAAMDQFYVAKYAEILDDFGVGKADLTPKHKRKLDDIVNKLKATDRLKAQLGGATDDALADHDANMALSLARAHAARDYLLAEGVPAGRLEVQSYGSDWARVKTESGKSKGKNRRVQIWLH